MTATNATPLIEPKPFEIVTKKGVKHTYILSQFDCITGLEIVSRTLASGIPKLGDYAVAQDMIFKAMEYVGVEIGEGNAKRVQRLNSRPLIINHVPSWEVLIILFKEVVNYNSDFFQSGEALSFCDDLLQKLLRKLTAMYTQSLQQSSDTAAQASMSSEPSTA